MTVPIQMKPPALLDITPRWWMYFGSHLFEDIGIVAQVLSGTVGLLQNSTKSLRFGMRTVEAEAVVPIDIDASALERERLRVVAELEAFAASVPQYAEAMRLRASEEAELLGAPPIERG